MTQVKAIQIDKPGRPSAMKFRTIELDEPAKGEALVRHTAVGLNYIDTYHRSGLYPLPLPSGSAVRRRASSRPWARVSSMLSPGIGSLTPAGRRVPTARRA